MRALPSHKHGGSFSCVPDGIATDPKIPLNDLLWFGFFGAMGSTNSLSASPRLASSAKAGHMLFAMRFPGNDCSMPEYL
jgi:hypothetical protein